jgi:pimeloyl-ACP methyl ester carboxylesterase
MGDLFVREWGGGGATAVLVHGDVFDGEATWARQRDLGAHHHLLVPDRRGFGQSPDGGREDFERDAGDVAALLGAGAHLVGHSYGGVVALLAAARRPEAVRSLAVVEPPAFALALEHPAVRALMAELTPLVGADPPMDPDEFLQRFVRAVGGDTSRLPSPLPPPLVRHTRLLMTCRPPWEAQVPVELLAAAGFPVLIVSGAHSAAFDAVCDVLESGLAAERAVIAGAGHSVPLTGAPFNERLERLWARAPADE